MAKTKGNLKEAVRMGARLKNLRIEKGLTGGQLAKLAGLSQAQTSRLENGKQGFRSATLQRLAKALDVEPVYFYLDSEADTYGKTSMALNAALRRQEFRDLVNGAARAYMRNPAEFMERAAAVKKLTKDVFGRDRGGAGVRAKGTIGP